MARPRFDRKKKPAAPRPPTADDLFADELRHKCAEAIVEWLKAGVDVRRPIKSLTLAEVKNMAEACTARWIVVVSQRIEQGDPPAEASEYARLLFGG